GSQALVRVALVDVTEQRKAEQAARRHLEETARLQRLEVAHELATQLAHELNQPLGAITLFAEASLQQLGRLSTDEALLKNSLQRIRVQALRGGEIIRRLRAFLGRAEIDASPLDINAVVVTTCTLIKPTLEDEGIRLELDLGDDLPPVMGVQVHLEQVLLNLLTNALEAIRETDSATGHIQIETRRQQNAAQVSVRDTGPGIGPEVAERLFEPLYTTKPHGLGVGLCISRSLIEFHGGRLWVEARQPGGVFHFEVPYAP
ncbi:MAG: ATP-binding protein, partial [Candidatus Competibacteraceae bacterium]|nr:ATP-binding protein [Candidatus Competibacteraceae bacterium]